ncbi:MAG: SH3 domain-containing protein [Candidatus Binatia bacterium]
MFLVVLLLEGPFPAGPVYGQASQAAVQNQASEEVTAEEVGYGVGSVVASFFYAPIKLGYAGLGLVTGGLGDVLSAGDKDVANNIIRPAVRGDYVITPDHLQGKKPVGFIGSFPPSEPYVLAISPGSYRVVRPTTVYSQPNERSEKIVTIDAGTKVEVVEQSGNWLRIQSRHGRAPGFIPNEAISKETSSLAR